MTTNTYIFEDLKIRKHFNISKLHNIKHYIDAIQSHGTADGFNTEGTECLHIDLAKMGYKATNKKQFIKQMTIWLRRQESIQRFCQYLQWAIPGYTARILKNGDNVDEDEDEDEYEEEDEVDEIAAGDEVKESYTVARKPALRNVLVMSIVDDFGAIDFLQHLSSFINMEPLIGNTVPSAASTFDLYKQVQFVLSPIPEVTSKFMPDVIHAVRAVPAVITSQGIKQAVPSRFSTVLIQESPSIAAGRCQGTPSLSYPHYETRQSQLRSHSDLHPNSLHPSTQTSLL